MLFFYRLVFFFSFDENECGTCMSILMPCNFYYRNESLVNDEVMFMCMPIRLLPWRNTGKISDNGNEENRNKKIILNLIKMKAYHWTCIFHETIFLFFCFGIVFDISLNKQNKKKNGIKVATKSNVKFIMAVCLQFIKIVYSIYQLKCL